MNRFFVLVAGVCSAAPAFAQWQMQSIATQADFRGLSVVNDKVTWVSGTNGTIARTLDGGATWQLLRIPDTDKLDFRDIEAFSDKTASVLSIGPGPNSRIYKTTDGGTTWTRQFQNDDREVFYDALAFWDERHGIALSDPVKGYYRLIVTSDGGTTWTVAPTSQMPPANKGEGAFAASGTCLITHGKTDAWFVTGSAKQARLFHTTDRGQSWTVRETPITATVESAGAFSVAFRDAKQGIIVGGDYRQPDATGATAAITHDGGATWKSLDNRLPFRSAIAWAADRWVCVGTNGSDASDDGTTWKRLDTTNMNAVRFAANGTGWAVGPKGRIAKWTTPR